MCWWKQSPGSAILEAVFLTRAGGLWHLAEASLSKKCQKTRLTVWFFLASLLGMFGAKDMVNMGFGAEALNVFNKLTLVGLYDIKAISTVGTGSVDTTFIWKLIVLGVIAVVCYAVGALRFQKKDLPL